MQSRSAKPLVSVLMPARDAAGTVSRAVQSIVEQTFCEWELIAVDDGSRDGTAQLLADWQARDPRIRVLTTQRAGLVSALNLGLSHVRGDLIARMDADDESAPPRLAEQYGFLQQQPDVGVVASRVRFGGDAHQNAGYALHVDWLNSLLTPDEIALNRFVESPLAHPSVMFRRGLVDLFGGYRAGDFPEDYELWLRWAEAGVKMAKVPSILLTWYDAPARLSRSDPRYTPEAFYRTKAPYVAAEVKRQLGARSLWIWGAGRPTRKRAALVESYGLRIGGYIDIDAKKTGRLHDCPVILPEMIAAPEEIFVLGYVAKRGARELIRAHLANRGFREGADFLMCA